MHVTRLVNLTHGCVNQGVARLSFAPGFKKGLGGRTSFPFDGIVLRFKRTLRYVGVVMQNLHVKVTPNQLAQPGARAHITLCMTIKSRLRQRANRYGAKAQVHTEVAGTFHAGEVAGLFVLRHAR